MFPLIHLWTSHTYLVLALSLAQFPHIVGPPKSFIQGASHPMHMGPKGTLADMHDTHVVALASAHIHALPSHQTSLKKLKFKDKN